MKTIEGLAVIEIIEDAVEYIERNYGQDCEAIRLMDKLATRTYMAVPVKSLEISLRGIDGIANVASAVRRARMQICGDQHHKQRSSRGKARAVGQRMGR